VTASRKPTIGVQAGVLGARPTGLGQCVLGMVPPLSRMHEGLVVYTSAPEALAGLAARIGRGPALIRPERGVAGHVARLLWCQTSLRARVRRDRVDVLLNTAPEGVLGTRVPQVTVLHDLIPLAFPQQFPRQQFYFRRLVPALLRQSRRIVVNSEATKRDAIARYGLPAARLQTIAWGYDAARFRPDGERPRDLPGPYVLAVGSLLPHKNLGTLVEAMGRIRPTRPVRLVVAGPGRAAEVRRLRTHAERCGVDLDYRSYAAPAELAALYRGAEAVAVPSLREGFGFTALEAMASGTPVVVSNTSSLPEVVGEAGLLVDPTDAGQIATAIVRLLTERGLRDGLVARGLERARGFSWERAAAAVSNVLEEVAAEWGDP